MRKLYVTVGFPGSGKTTFVRETFPNAVILSEKDIINIVSVERNEDLDEMYLAFLISAARIGLVYDQDVVVDADCLDKDMRRCFVKMGIAWKAEVIAVVMDVDQELSRQNSRNPLKNVNKKSPDYEYDPVEFEEGFDKVIFVSRVDGDYKVKEWTNE